MDPKRVIPGFKPREKCNINLLNAQGSTEISKEIVRFGLDISFRIQE